MTAITRLYSSLFYEVARGNVTGASFVSKFGRNEDVDVTEEIIAFNGGSVTPFPTSAGTIEAISSSTDDAAAGTGARKIIVQGLDENWLEVEEELTMNGTSASTASTNQFIRVNRVYVSEAGSYSSIAGSNVGNISVRFSSAGSVFVVVAAGSGQSESSVYSVAADKHCYLKYFRLNVASTKTATIKFYKRENADDVTVPVSSPRLLRGFGGVAGQQDSDYELTVSFPGKTDIYITGANGTSTEISASYDLIKIQNGAI